jgi:hypothetical protein
MARRKRPKADPQIRRKVSKLFPEPASTLPRKLGTLRVYGVRTITRFGGWHKAMILVDNGQALQIRFYGWKKNATGEWKQRQNFNLTGRNMLELLDVLQQILMVFPDGLPSHRSGKTGVGEE